MLSIIAAVSKNGVIGKNGELPWYLPEDLKHFRKLTEGHTVLMGRKTFESILNRLGKPLPNRKNIIITRQTGYKFPLPSHPEHACRQAGGGEGSQNPPAASRNDSRQDVEIFPNIQDALAANQNENIFIIGGGEIYGQTINLADKLYITEVHEDINGDVYFPEIDKNVWRETSHENRDGFSFVEYSK